MTQRISTDAELLREVLGSLAHDLGGMSSALALRADALGPEARTSDAAALHDIADEMRSLGRHLRFLRGPRGAEAASPVNAGSLHTWWSVMERVGGSCLVRGVALEGEIAELQVTPEQAYALTFVVLALFRDLVRRGLKGPAAVRLIAQQDGDGAAMLVRAVRPDGTPVPLRRRESGWSSYARRRAQAAGLQLEAHDDAQRIRMPVSPR
ncbi:MAG: hypothetical protein ABIZ91_17525 [Gemmatimonadaceae bacterium]